MLILSRKDGEKIVIDEKIVIEVVRISGNRVTLGIAAPSNVKILRSELEPKDLAPAPAFSKLTRAS